jgi:uncharacterized protein involved in exopolysaccharide biosynthesis
MQHVYRSDATIIIKDPSNTQSTVQMGAYSSLINHVSMSNEILQLQSRELMQTVVTTLDADIDYLEKDRLRYVELYRNAPVRMFVFRNEEDFQCMLKVTPSGEMQITVEGSGLEKQTVQLGDTLLVQGHRVVFSPNSSFSSYMGKEIKVVKAQVPYRAAQIVSRLKVVQAETDGSILQLTLMDYSHRRADDLLNTLVQKYNEDAVREKNRIAVNTAAFINERLDIIQEELGSVE